MQQREIVREVERIIMSVGSNNVSGLHQVINHLMRRNERLETLLDEAQAADKSKLQHELKHAKAQIEWFNRNYDSEKRRADALDSLVKKLLSGDTNLTEEEQITLAIKRQEVRWEKEAQSKI
jgi:uncharacterized protein YpuA (DUF1002 family)